MTGQQATRPVPRASVYPHPDVTQSDTRTRITTNVLICTRCCETVRTEDATSSPHDGDGGAAGGGREIAVSFLPTGGAAAAEASAERLLEFLVLEAVDEGVDARVEEHHEDGEVVEVGAVVLGVTQVEHEEVHLVPRPADHEAGPDKQDGEQQNVSELYEGVFNIILFLRLLGQCLNVLVVLR